MDKEFNTDTCQTEIKSSEAKEIRCQAAVQLIEQLYNIQLLALTSRNITDDVCEKYRLHPIQYYFNEKVLDMTRHYLEEDTIYHISDAFFVHFMIFIVSDIPYMFGPFCTVILSETDAKSILRQCSVDLDAKSFLTYRGAFPLMKEIEAYNIVSSFIHIVSPDENGKTIRRISSEHDIQDTEKSDESKRANYSAMIEQRYTHEKKFMEDITSGSTRSAINNLHNMQQDVSYLKRIGTTLESEKIGAAITRTTVRIAAMQAGLPALIIDKLSTENTVETMGAKTTEEILLAKEKMVRNFCKAIREIRENKYSARVQSIIYYLNHDYSKLISFSELSKDLNVSENRLISSFKKEVGTTPNAYLTKIRMQNAAHLLVSGGMSVADVSNAVGISDSNYFVKLFKKELGETPTEYRKRHTT
jgi:Response regulator containing CheY-like receiver domain and AraC-type DNA-binding domain